MNTNMTGEERRESLLKLLQEADVPQSGTALAKHFGVSRQIIVQDIALLRVTEGNILSTHQGYLLYKKEKSENARRIFKVYHTDAQMQDELNTIVDEGGRLLDVHIHHDIYGQITAQLIINNRADVTAFLEKVSKNKTKPLNELTNGIHYHTVEASSEEVLDRIESRLKEKKYLL